MLRKTLAIIVAFNAILLPVAAQTSASSVQVEKGVVALTTQNASEVTTNSKLKISVELEEKAFALLKTTAREAARLNLPENRIRYLVDAADLTWSQDQKTAREWFVSATSDFRIVMQTLDALYQKRESGDLENDSFFGEDTSQFRVYSFQRVRQNMLLTIAKYDSQMALDFLRETARENFKDFGWNDASFESQLAIIVARNNPGRALEIGQQKLAKNSFEGLDELINNLYEKDPEKGAKLASDASRKLRTSNLIENQAAYYAASALFRQAAAKLEDVEKNNETRLLLDKSEVSGLAETVAKAVSENSKASRYYSNPSPEELEQLKKYAPATIAQYEQQAKIKRTKAKNDISSEEVEDPSSPSSVATLAAEQKRENEQQAQTEAMTQIMKSVDPSNEKISLDETKQALSKIKNRLQRFIAVSQIARALAERGEKEAASGLLAEINNQQIAQPRKAADMLQNLLIASANSNIDPERSFTTLETSIYELNSVIASFARVGEFIGVKEMMDDNEFSLAGFAGEMLQRGVAGQQIGAEQLIVDLAKTDFERTVGLANKFERAEIRLEARMMIARALLSDKKIDKTSAQNNAIASQGSD
jgi:hypothetical protein